MVRLAPPALEHCSLFSQSSLSFVKQSSTLCVPFCRKTIAVLTVQHLDGKTGQHFLDGYQLFCQQTLGTLDAVSGGIDEARATQDSPYESDQSSDDNPQGFDTDPIL